MGQWYGPGPAPDPRRPTPPHRRVHSTPQGHPPLDGICLRRPVEGPYHHEPMRAPLPARAPTTPTNPTTPGPAEAARARRRHRASHPRPKRGHAHARRASAHAAHAAPRRPPCPRAAPPAEESRRSRPGQRTNRPGSGRPLVLRRLALVAGYGARAREAATARTRREAPPGWATTGTAGA